MTEIRSMFSKVYGQVEAFLMTYLVPVDKPGFIFKWLFRGPKYLYKLGLGVLVSSSVMILTTTGRISGKQRETALGYYFDAENNHYNLMSGWKGKTDWFRNAVANHEVQIQIGSKKMTARVVKATDEEVAEQMLLVVQKEPGALKMWEHTAGAKLKPTYKNLLTVADAFPSL